MVDDLLEEQKGSWFRHKRRTDLEVFQEDK